MIGEPIVIAATIGDDKIRTIQRREIAGGGLVLVGIVVLATQDGHNIHILVAIGGLLGEVAPDRCGGDDLDRLAVGGGVGRASIGAGRQTRAEKQNSGDAG